MRLTHQWGLLLLAVLLAGCSGGGASPATSPAPAVEGAGEAATIDRILAGSTR